MGKEEVTAVKKRRKLNTSTSNDGTKSVPVDVYKVLTKIYKM